MLLVPGIANASNINEYPPYVNVRNEELYDIEKIINDEEVIVRLKKQALKAKLLHVKFIMRDWCLAEAMNPNMI